MPTRQPTHENDESTDIVRVPVRPPRAPAAYRPTDHYLQQQRERVPEFDQSLPRRVIETGEVTRVPGASVEDGNQFGTTVAFTTTVRGESWTVVVALRPKAFATDAKHRAVTVYQGFPAGDGGAG